MNKNIKNDFPIFQKNKNLVYLDSAATSQKPKVVIDEIREYYENYNANVRRGLYPIAERATEKVEEVRRKVAKFINAKDAKEIIFVRNTTEAINLVAYSMSHNVKRGDKVVTTIMEHHSNFVPWQQLCIKNGAKLEVIDIGKNFQLNLSVIPARRFEETSPLGGKAGIHDISRSPIKSGMTRMIQNSKLLAITHVSNVLGTVNSIKEIILRVRNEATNREVMKNSSQQSSNNKISYPLVLVDAAQSVPHMKVDVQNLDCDFLAFSGHKMMAGTGIGVLYGKEKVLEKMSSFLFGGDMIQSVSLDRTIFADIPYKFEAGTPDIAGIISLGAAIDYLEKIGMENIQKHEKELTKYCLQLMEKIKGLTVYGPNNTNQRSGVVSFNINGVHSHDVAQILGDMGICIRAGMHCAMPLHTRLGVVATARASFYIYNDEEDIDKLIKGIKKIKEIFKK